MVRKIFISVGITAILFLVGSNIYLGKLKQGSSYIAPVPQAAIKPVEASEVKSMDSPDGKLTLVMKTTQKGEQTVYSFSISGKEIFTKTLDSATSISIPYNTWSPDGKYVFLKESGTSGVNFFALSVKVPSNEQSDQTASISSSFAEKYPDLIIGNVTGWGGVNLIVINSAKLDGSRGPSFWFEMPSHALIQLSTHF
jgi:hypothetical protein